MDKKVDFTYPEGLTKACEECLGFMNEEERESMMITFIDNVIQF